MGFLKKQKVIVNFFIKIMDNLTGILCSHLETPVLFSLVMIFYENDMTNYKIWIIVFSVKITNLMAIDSKL
jgi:uncharacterized membrane protein